MIVWFVSSDRHIKFKKIYGFKIDNFANFTNFTNFFCFWTFGIMISFIRVSKWGKNKSRRWQKKSAKKWFQKQRCQYAGQFSILCDVVVQRNSWFNLDASQILFCRKNYKNKSDTIKPDYLVDHPAKFSLFSDFS